MPMQLAQTLPDMTKKVDSRIKGNDVGGLDPL